MSVLNIGHQVSYLNVCMWQGTEAIEAIIPHNLYFQNKLEGQSFTTETFKQMSKLRFLCISKVNLSGSFEQIFEDLRVLVWDGCPLKYFPSDFYPEKLVILELGQSNMRTLWSPNMVGIPRIFLVYIYDNFCIKF